MRMEALDCIVKLYGLGALKKRVIVQVEAPKPAPRDEYRNNPEAAALARKVYELLLRGPAPPPDKGSPAGPHKPPPKPKSKFVGFVSATGNGNGNGNGAH
jgi:hypothetical protein